MKELTRIEGIRSEAAILVGVILPDRNTEGDPLEELEGLAETAGARVVGQMTQRRDGPDRTTYLGKGKLEELELMVIDIRASVVLFDDELSPRQQREIERQRIDEQQRALETDVQLRSTELRHRIRLEQQNLQLLSGGLVPQAEITRDAALAAYTTGRAAFIDLLDAERMLFELQLDEISVRERLHEAVATMHRVLGTPIDL